MFFDFCFKIVNLRYVYTVCVRCSYLYITNFYTYCQVCVPRYTYLRYVPGTAWLNDFQNMFFQNNFFSRFWTSIYVFFKTKFSFHFFNFFFKKIKKIFSNIKNLFHVFLTTRNQKFLDLRCQFLKTSFWQTALFSLNYFCLSSRNFRDIKMILENKKIIVVRLLFFI